MQRINYRLRGGYIAIALLPPLVVLAIHIARVRFLPALWQADYLMHFLGGFAIAWMFTILANCLLVCGFLKEVPRWLLYYAIWGTVALIGVGFEFFELLADRYFGTHMQFSIPETMGDLFMDLAGGLVFLIIYGCWRQVRR